MVDLSQNAILEDDQIFLHKQERTIEIERDVKKRSYAQACYMPTKADTYVAAFRRWIVDMAGGSPAWPEGSRTDATRARPRRRSCSTGTSRTP